MNETCSLLLRNNLVKDSELMFKVSSPVLSMHDMAYLLFLKALLILCASAAFEIADMWESLQLSTVNTGYYQEKPLGQD